MAGIIQGVRRKEGGMDLATTRLRDRSRIMHGIALVSVLLLQSVIAFAQTTPTSELAAAAIELTEQDVIYDPSYFSIPYPNGDVPAEKGVCTDVVIRAYRTLGIDIQQLVHEDMKSNFSKYPKNWGLKRPDTNIDHRRVPNLMIYFQRKGAELPMTKNALDYNAGDVVCWDLGGGITHIGIVVKERSAESNRPMIVHNIGAGQVLEDCLFKFEQIGHYRYPAL